jgi:DNA-binding IclR family transcriptional regulator
LYPTASGKAWLSTLPVEAAMKQVLRTGFVEADRYGPNVIRDIDALMREIKTTAKRGFGLALSEAEPGVTAIAAAILLDGGSTGVGTVSIAGPSVRMTEKRVRELAPRVVAAARELAELWPIRVRQSELGSTRAREAARA